VPQAVGSGSIEAGVASLTRYVGDIPAVDIFYQPFLFDSEEKVRAAVAKGSAIRGPIDEAIAETGATVLWWQAYGGAVILSNGGPIATPADMEGKKVRVFGKTLGDFVTAAGGAPTLISGSEQYLAYQRGTVDIGMTGVSGVKSRSLWEVMDTITVTNHADIEFIVVANTDWWESLPAEHRAIIETAAANAEAACPRRHEPDRGRRLRRGQGERHERLRADRRRDGGLARRLPAGLRPSRAAAPPARCSTCRPGSPSFPSRSALACCWRRR
jgi:C4-dicarboxylate-binding protein DctP